MCRPIATHGMLRMPGIDPLRAEPTLTRRQAVAREERIARELAETLAQNRRGLWIIAVGLLAILLELLGVLP